MNRPRVIAVVSAILGSSAGFLVLSRWRLAGTFTGAALFPVVFTLVSYCSTESLDRVGKWSRRYLPLVNRRDESRRGNGGQLALFTMPPDPGKVAQAEAGSENRPPKSLGHRLQWSLAALALLAFAASIYTLVQPANAGKTIVRERVIENRIVQETVTVTSPMPKSTALAAVSPATSTTTDPGATSETTSTTAVQTEPDPGTGGTTTSSTTTTSLPTGGGN